MQEPHWGTVTLLVYAKLDEAQWSGYRVWALCARDWELGSLQVKPMTYAIDNCSFQAWGSELLGQGKHWLAQCQDNVTEWDIGSGYWQLNFPVGQHYKGTMSVHCQKLVLILV